TLLGRKPAQRTRGAYARDAIAGDGDVAQKPGRAGSVDHAPVLEDKVELGLGTRRGGRWSAAAGDEGETAEKNRAAGHFFFLTLAACCSASFALKRSRMFRSSLLTSLW